MQWAFKKQTGFTIVELLIVIVVIAILAAITIVAYTGIQNSARKSALQNNVQQVAKKLASRAVASGEVYAEPADFATTAGVSSGNGTTYTYIPSTDRKNYCVSATNDANPALSYAITSVTGAVVEGQCVKNLATNPSFESSTGSYTFSGTTGSMSNLWAVSGSNSVRLIPSVTTTDTFIRLGGQGNLLGLTPGQTYTVSAVSRLGAAQTGTLDGRARSIVSYSWTGTTAGTLASTTQMSNAPGTLVHSQTFTLPSTVTGLEIRLYNGASNSADNSVFWDNLIITEGTRANQYGDGSNTEWFWDGTPHASVSIGPATLRQ